MRKKILLLGYMRKNLGDDLFIAILLNRYKNIDFIVRTNDKKDLQPFKMYKNLKVVPQEGSLSEFNMDGYDACVYIGGSVMMELKRGLMLQQNINAFIENSKKPFFYISSNFGPYKTQEFYDECAKTFKMIDGVTFRDEYSYNEFKQYDSVGYAPDLVFGLNMKKKKTIKDSIGISLIDLSLPARGEKFNSLDSSYCNMLKNNISDFIKQGKTIYLFSYCDYEGDCNTIEKVLKLLSEEDKKHVKVVKYTGKPGNLYEFIRKYSSMEKMICTRFHGLVLSLVFRQELMVISYSKKLEKMLEKVPEEFKYIEIDENIGELKIKLDWFKAIKEENLEPLSKNSVNQFKKFEEKMGLKIKQKGFKIKKAPLKKRIKRKLKDIKKKIIKK